MFTKHAYCDADILEIKSSPVRQVTASLDTMGDFNNYRTQDGYMYVRIRAISSRVNKNHDGWPSIELAGSPDIFSRHQSSTGFTVEAKEGNPKKGFAAFLGKPIFVDHNNTNPHRGRGVIVDSKFRVLDDKTASVDDYWKSSDVDHEHLPASEIELLLEVDAKQYPKFAKAIKNGDLDGFSMGCNVEYTKCSHCGNIAHDPDEFCSHVLMKGAHHDFKTADGHRISRKSYENCYGCSFFEISGVFEPADETALAREVRSSVIHEGIFTDGVNDFEGDPVRPGHEQMVSDLAMKYQMQGVDEDSAYQMAQEQLNRSPMGQVPGHGEGGSINDFLPGKYDRIPDGVQQGIDDQSIRNDPRWSNVKTAENPLPQDLMTKAPDEVDTLREDQTCPICGSPMDSEECDVCHYVKPPKEFDNPDLQEAQKVREEMKTQDEAEANSADPSQQQTTVGPTQSPPGAPGPSKMPMAASVTSDMRWKPTADQVTAARINKSEKPMNPSGTTSNQPKDEIIKSDQTQPVTSAMRTARQLIAKAQTNNGETMNRRTADGPTPPGDTSADKRVDVMGVGGFDQASNEEASKAQAQVDVMGVGGTGVSDVSADSTESLPTAGESSDDSGFNSDKTTDDSGPTSTYGDSDGSHSGVSDPVTSETPYWVDESKWSKVRLHADENDGTLEAQPQQGDPVAGGGSAVKGVQPIAESFGDRVNVLEHMTTPANNSGPTKTWSGTDGNGVLKQQDPVTREDQEWGGVKVPDVTLHTNSSVESRVLNAHRLADLELELGMVEPAEKWNRIASLTRSDPREVATRLSTLDQVKVTGTKMAAQHKLATRVPRAFGHATVASKDFERIASETSQPEAIDDTHFDSALFTR